MSNLTEKKASNLKKAYDNIDALGIEMTTKQYIELTRILKDYGLSEWREGREEIKRIYNL